ncbi:MAG TPA: Gfo/Idh/MocA family oxidoreductase [Planctomycetota bacterium]|nr:Gfo/Idh/MocA family oxidoreductase [Planctomycetota bacterium]
MADEVVLGLIGCGGMMGAHARGLKALWDAGLRGFRVAATCDVALDRAEKLAAEVAAFQVTKPTVYADFEKMLDAEKGLDAVDLSLVHRDHHKIAIPCLQAGKHVTIEKPLAITCRAAQAIVAAAKKAGRLLQTAENYRRSPENRAIRWANAQGRIGANRQVYWVDAGERLWYWNWRDHRDLAGGGWSMDGGVHFADLFRYHVGDVKSLYALSRTYFPTRYRDREKLTDPVAATVEDTTLAVLEFANGVSGVWTSTMAAPGRGFNQRVLYGAHGSLSWGAGLKTRTEEVAMADLIEQHKAALGEAEREKLFPRGVTDTVATELWEFLQAIQGKATIETDGVEGLKALAICMALYESSVLGQPIAIADVESCKVETYQADLNEAAGF